MKKFHRQINIQINDNVELTSTRVKNIQGVYNLVQLFPDDAEFANLFVVNVMSNSDVTDVIAVLAQIEHVKDVELVESRSVC